MPKIRIPCALPDANGRRKACPYRKKVTDKEEKMKFEKHLVANRVTMDKKIPRRC